jgi:anti-sigma factor RsiW
MVRDLFDRWARRRHALSCRQAVDLMTDYLEAALPPAKRSAFERHLAQCEACTAYLRQMELTVATLGRLEPEQLPPEVVEELVAVYRRWRSP